MNELATSLICSLSSLFPSAGCLKRLCALLRSTRLAFFDLNRRMQQVRITILRIIQGVITSGWCSSPQSAKRTDSRKRCGDAAATRNHFDEATSPSHQSASGCGWCSDHSEMMFDSCKDGFSSSGGARHGFAALGDQSAFNLCLENTIEYWLATRGNSTRQR